MKSRQGGLNYAKYGCDLMNGICDARNCGKPAEIELQQERAELCEKHWGRYVKESPVVLKRGRIIQIPVTRCDGKVEAVSKGDLNDNRENGKDYEKTGAEGDEGGGEHVG